MRMRKRYEIREMMDSGIGRYMVRGTIMLLEERGNAYNSSTPVSLEFLETAPNGNEIRIHNFPPQNSPHRITWKLRKHQD